MVGKRRVVRRNRGMGFFSNLWDGIKQGFNAVNSVVPIGDILKNTRAISNGLSMIPGVGSSAAGLARAVGLGKRRARKVGGRKRKASKRKVGGMKRSANYVLPANYMVASGRKRRGGAMMMMPSHMAGSGLNL
jgi:hypothetical protein